MELIRKNHSSVSFFTTFQPMDVVVTMGCNVQCPNLPCKHREYLELDNPRGMNDMVFTETLALIHEKILGLKERIQNEML